MGCDRKTKVEGGDPDESDGGREEDEPLERDVPGTVCQRSAKLAQEAVYFVVHRQQKNQVRCRGSESESEISDQR